MAWDRLTKLSIGNQSTGVIVSDLDIDFDVQRSITLAENTAHFNIYNAKESTRRDILVQGASIIFEAGYKDETSSSIFGGNITEVSTRKVGTDWITEIKAIAGRGSAIKLENIDVSISYSAGTVINRPIMDIAALVGLVVHGIANATVILSNGFVFAGSVNGALRYLKDVLYSFGINMYIDNYELVIHRIGTPSRFNVVLLSYTGGLLTIEDITESQTQADTSISKREDIKKRLKFTSLLISQLQINSPVTFRTENVSATYILEKIRFHGNNYGGDFNCEGEVVES
jgi:hypothetical protein